MRSALSRSLLQMVILGACIIAAFLLFPERLSSAAAANGLTGKLIVGYQGWFGCPGDYENNKFWQHWFLKGVAPSNFTVDLLPSVRTIEPADLCDTGLRRPDGSMIRLYSAQNGKVVAAHFRWMRDYGIDGAAVQRFISEMGDPVKKRRSDHVVTNARAAAEVSGRVFFVTYDVSGANPETVATDIRNDWQHLVDDLKITDSSSYLRDRGKPALQLWGFGFGDRPGTPEQVLALIADLKSGRSGLRAVTLIGGVPAHWRVLSRDSKSDPAWATVYRSYDVISPWLVGRFSDDEGIDIFIREKILPDIAETKRLGIGYMPVIFPGFSWYNKMMNVGKPNQAVLNYIPRRCGAFLWHQVSALLAAGVDTLYAAMFDEVDEGTALFPVETRMDKLPIGANMVFLNQDGCALPDDWYMRVTGKAAEYLRKGEPPPRRLDAVIRP
jgi:hypothetical protein